MNLVVTNDDGVEAPGVWALARELSPLGQVALYAPTRNYSGAGMSITLRRELRLCPATPPPETEDIAVHPGLEAEVRLSPTAPPPRAKLDIPAFALDAPPASLAVIGAAHAFGGRADALVSGINPGWNPGEEPYKVSGTVGAARVAVERGLLGVAVSTEYFGAENQYPAIAAATRRLLQSIKAQFETLPNVLVNVNVPDGFGEDSPVRLTRPSLFTLFRDCTLDDCEVDENGVSVRVKFGDYFDEEPTPGDEMHALAEGAVAITVTGPKPGHVVLDDPWPAVVQAFRP